LQRKTTLCRAHLVAGTGFAAALCLLLLLPLAPARAQEAPRQKAATIEGENLLVKIPGGVSEQSGRGPFELTSGSEITLRSGVARMVLNDGSEIDICGPAQLTLLESGGAVTLALNYGRVHARTPASLPLEILTPMVKATPISVGGRARDTVVGMDSAGAVCTLAVHGAARLENVLAGNSLVVPQGGELVAPDGDLDRPAFAPGNCRCDVLLARDTPPLPAASPPPSRHVEPRAASAETRPASGVEKPAEKTPAANQPTLTAVMPPLTFDARSPEPPAPRPEVVILLAELRAPPATVFTGRVEKKARVQTVAALAPASTVSESGTATQSKAGFGSKFRNFFRRLFGGRSRG